MLVDDAKYFLPSSYGNNTHFYGNDINNLIEIGLINDLGRGTVNVLRERANILCWNKNFMLTCNKPADGNKITTLPTRGRTFTQVGNEIASLTGFCATDEELCSYAEYMRKEYPFIKFELTKINPT